MNAGAPHFLWGKGKEELARTSGRYVLHEHKCDVKVNAVGFLRGEQGSGGFSGLLLLRSPAAAEERLLDGRFGRPRTAPHAKHGNSRPSAHEKGRGPSGPRPSRAIRLLEDVPCRLFGLCGAAAGASGALALSSAGGLAAAGRLVLRGLLNGPFNLLAYTGHALYRSFRTAYTIFLFLPRRHEAPNPDTVSGGGTGRARRAARRSSIGKRSRGRRGAWRGCPPRTRSFAIPSGRRVRSSDAKAR